MQPKKLLFGSMFLGGCLVLSRMLFAKHASAKLPATREPYDAVDAFVEEQMHHLKIPGAALAIVEGDQIVHYRGFGCARPRGEAPSPQTPFFIGSLTKSVTALAVMQLVEAGKVELDSPVQHYLPWFRVADPVATAQITVRHLLNQTSGLPTIPSQVTLADFDPDPGATERLVQKAADIKTSPVGEKVEYSNLNYNILGLVVEAVSGETYGRYIQHHIYDPLGMQHSYILKADAQKNGLAAGYRHWFSFPMPSRNLPVPIGSLPSGQLISCAEDMVHYLIANLNGGHYGDVQVLSGEGMDELHRGVKEYITFGISSGKYGMGWFDMDLGQTKVYSHSGNTPDFSAYMALIPEQKKGLVLLFNADPYGLPPITEEVGLNVTALLAGLQPTPSKWSYVQWVMRLLPLVPLFQVIGALATLKTLRSWQHHPEQRPGKACLWRQHILLPLIPNLSLAFLREYVSSNGLLRFFHLFMPDLAWIIEISGSFARLWSILRARLMLNVLRNHSQ